MMERRSFLKGLAGAVGAALGGFGLGKAKPVATKCEYEMGPTVIDKRAVPDFNRLFAGQRDAIDKAIGPDPFPDDIRPYRFLTEDNILAMVRNTKMSMNRILRSTR